tara:strand:- start:3671 stop:4447 length:777 start_codon:yes stop_codon:yes gene_type:complete
MIKKCKVCNEIIKEEYQKCKMIDYGSFSNIFSICNKNLIIKNFLEFNRELEISNIISNLNKPYLLKPIKIKNLQIIYPRINGLTFRNYFDINVIDSEDNKYQVIKKIFDILLDLENTGFNHFDISPGNIMIENHTNKIYLIDYNYISNKCLEKIYLGSYGYVPPEKILYNQVIFNKFDIYSFGCIVGEYIFRNKLFRITNFNKYNTLQSFLDKQIKLSLKRINNNKIKNFYQILLTNSLQLDYIKRKSFNEINFLLNN